MGVSDVGNIQEWGKDAGITTAWWFVNASVTYVFYHPWQSLSSLFLIDRFGIAGARFVGRAGLAMLKSNLRLGLDISKIALQELGPAFKPNNLLQPFVRVAPRISAAVARGAGGFMWVGRGVVAGSRVAAPPMLGLAVVGLVMEGPRLHMDLATDPNSGAYVLNEEGTQIIATPYLNGVTGTGLM